jgi:hypothetical protein
VNQPEKMYGAKEGTGHHDGQVRYANVVFTYAPNFADGSYREGVVEDAEDHVTFEFRSPYVIGATAPNDKPWGVYEAGGRNGLIVSGADCAVDVSVNGGRTWHGGSRDLTDFVKGHNQYWLRLGAGAAKLRGSKLSWRTVCQANVATMPHLRDGVNRVTFVAGGTGVVSAGPTRAMAEAHVVEGKLDSPAVTLELKTPRGEKAVRLYAASWQASGAPPAPEVSYFIEYSTDAGKTWRPVVKDWRIVRRPPEPADFWSQSFCWGDVKLPNVNGPVRVRFRNTGGKAYRNVEAHLAYEVAGSSPTRVTFRWRDASGQLRSAGHTYRGGPGVEDASWQFDAGAGVRPYSVAYEQ